MSGSTDCSRRKPSGTGKQRPDASYRAGQLVAEPPRSALPLGGFIIGFVLDKSLGTKPWLMLVMLFLGFRGRRLERLSDFKQPVRQRPDA